MNGWSSINSPYDGVGSNSTNIQYQSQNNNGFDNKRNDKVEQGKGPNFFEKTGVYLSVIGILLTGLVGYFMQLQEVKSQISENQKSLAVLQKGIESIEDKITGASKQIDGVRSLELQQNGMKYKFEELEKRTYRLEKANELLEKRIK